MKKIICLFALFACYISTKDVSAQSITNQIYDEYAFVNRVSDLKDKIDFVKKGDEKPFLEMAFRLRDPKSVESVLVSVGSEKNDKSIFSELLKITSNENVSSYKYKNENKTMQYDACRIHENLPEKTILPQVMWATIIVKEKDKPAHEPFYIKIGQ